MSERVVVLAVTKMLSGMCTGGISLETKQWVRPVKEFGTILKGDLTYSDHVVMRPFDVVDFAMINHRPKPPHIEDWTCDFVRSRPRRIGRVNDNDRLKFLEHYSEPESPNQILRAERSLTFFEPSDVEAIFAFDSYSEKYDVRMKIAGMGDRPIAVTDIKWRALGRSLLDGAESLMMASDDMRARLGIERVFIALGLSRLHEGKHWPLVIGVHTWPDYEIEVDYGRL